MPQEDIVTQIIEQLESKDETSIVIEDMVFAIRELYVMNDKPGMKTLYQKFHYWMTSKIKEIKKPDLVDDDIKKRLYEYCGIADEYIATKDIEHSIRCAEDGVFNNNGDVRRFFRSALNYCPNKKVN